MSRIVRKNRKLCLLLFAVMSLFITFFGMSKTMAYYQKNANANVLFETTEYVPLTIGLDNTIYPSGNNSSEVFLTVNNPNDYNVTYTISFDNPNATYLVDFGALTTYEVNANSGNAHVITISGATGATITVSINATAPYSVTHTKVINFDNINPTVNDIGGGTTLKAGGQTLTLKCTDSAGITAYYFGTTEPTSTNSITTNTSADLTALTGSGLSKTVSSEGTYWLGCKDASGNFAKKNIVIRKYHVQNLLEKTTSNGSLIYTSNNYGNSGSTQTYYVKDGTSLTLTSIYTIPADSSAADFRGYTTTAPSNSVETLSTTAPTVTDDTTIYYMWFARSLCVLSYDFNALDNMNLWTYIYPERFEVAFSSTRMNTISLTGGGGWEVVSIPISTIANRAYRIEFDYENPNGYAALSSSYGGIGVQALTAVANNDNMSNSIQTSYLSTAQTNGVQHLIFEFTATGTTTYFAFNFGMAADNAAMTIRLGNFKIVEFKERGSTITNIPTLVNASYTFSGWYTDTDGGTKLSSGATINDSVAYYARASGKSYYLTYGGIGSTILNISGLFGKYDALYHNGNTLYDMGSRAANGTATGVTFTSDYMEFSGTTSSWVSLGEMNSNYMTLEAIIELTQTPTGTGYILGNLETGGGGMLVTSAKKVQAGFYINGSYRWIASDATLELNKKYHVAFTYDGSNEKIYINGELDKSYTIAGTIAPPQSSTVMAIGCNPYGNNCGQETFKGRIYSAAIYDYDLYGVDIEDDGGKEVTQGSVYGILPAPQRAGYRFAGWYSAPTGGVQITSGSVVNAGKDHTIYARWTATNYTLTINPNGGTFNGKTSNTTVTQTFGTTFGILNNPSKPGYVFNGWTFSGTGEYNFYNKDSTASSTSTVSYNSSSSTAPASYNNKGGSTVTTSIVSDSTSNGGYSAKIVTNGAASPGAGGMYVNILPATPGQIVVLQVNAKIPTGYNLQAGGVGQQYTGIGSIARADSWAGTGTWKSYYLVYYIGDTGTFYQAAYLYLDGSNNTSVTWYVNSITMRSFTKSQFYSLFKFKEGRGTLTASWATSGARVKFNLNGGSFNSTFVTNWVNGYNNVDSTSATRVYLYDIYYTTVPSDYYWTPDTRVTSRGGYTLDGWYTSASGGTKIFNADGTLVTNLSGYSNADGKWIKYDGNVEVYAHWSSYTLTLRYNVNGGTITTGTGTERWRASSSLVQRSVDSGSSWSTVSATINQGTTYLDLWNVGTYGATKTGYTINGTSAYNTKADGTGVDVNQDNTSATQSNPVTVARINGGNLTSNKTIDLYIKWIPAVYTITLNNQSATSAGTTAIYEKYNTGYYLNSGATTQMTTSANGITIPVKTGHTFGGYYTGTNGSGTRYIDENGKLTSSASTTNFTAAGTLYAKWTANSYTVTLVGANPISTSLDNTTVILEGALDTPIYQTNTLPTSSVGPDKLLSVSFDYRAAGGTNNFNVDFFPDPLPQQSFAATTTRQHADWQASSSSSAMTNSRIRFFDDIHDSNEKDITIMNVMLSGSTTKSVTYGGTYGTLPSPTRTGYTFNGWYTASTGGSQVSSSTQITGNTTWYARWTIIPIRAYYHAYGGTTGNGYSTVNGGWISNNGSSAFYQTIDWSTDIYNYTTFGLTRTDYTVPDGAEWCTQVDGGGTCLDHDVTYTYEYLKSLGSGNIVNGAYEIHFYMNWVANVVTKWRWRATCSCHTTSGTQTRASYGNYDYDTQDAAYLACTGGAPQGKCNSWCNSIGGTGAGYSQCIGLSNQ